MNKYDQKLIRELRRNFFPRVGSFHPHDMLPETAYHYTSHDGLRGIIESGSLWGTHYNYLNDASEIAYGREVALKVIDERIKEEGSNDVAAALEKARGELDALGQSADY